VHRNRTEFEQQDIFVPWKLDRMEKKCCENKSTAQKNDKNKRTKVIGDNGVRNPSIGADKSEADKEPWEENLLVNEESNAWGNFQVNESGNEVGNAQMGNTQDNVLGNAEGNDTHHRYYHVFREGELEGLCGLVLPPVDVVQSYYDEGNWCVVFERRAETV
jgi:hypothetical protein